MDEKINRRIIRKPELLSRVTLSDCSIWRMEKLGKFPKRVQLGECSVGWFEDEVDAWFEARAAERESQKPACGPDQHRNG